MLQSVRLFGRDLLESVFEGVPSFRSRSKSSASSRSRALRVCTISRQRQGRSWCASVRSSRWANWAQTVPTRATVVACSSVPADPSFPRPGATAEDNVGADVTTLGVLVHNHWVLAFQVDRLLAVENA